MKALRKISLMLVVLAALLGLGVMTAVADGPVANLTAVNAPYIDNQPHPIQAGASTWFRFDYQVNHDTGERPVTTITLPNGFATGIEFDIWSLNGIADMTNNTPVGRGSAVTVQIDGTPTQTADLRWFGAFGSSGPYYVRVTNTTMSDATAQLMISGDGVRLAPIAVTGASTTQSSTGSSTTPNTTQPSTGSTTTPSTTTQPGPNTDDPNKAVPLDDKEQTIPANSALWYSFNYTINTDISASVHPVVRIQLLNGNMSDLGFQVYSPEILGNWWQNTPLGVGTPTTTSSDGTTTQSSYLNWSGAFGASETYYVRVVNNTANPVPATLTIQVVN